MTQLRQPGFWKLLEKASQYKPCVRIVEHDIVMKPMNITKERWKREKKLYPETTMTIPLTSAKLTKIWLIIRARRKRKLYERKEEK